MKDNDPMAGRFVIMGLCILTICVNNFAQEKNDERTILRNQKPYPRYIDCFFITFSEKENEYLNQKQKNIWLPSKVRGDTIISLIHNFIYNKETPESASKNDSVIGVSESSRDTEFMWRFSPVEENISLVEIIDKMNQSEDSNFIVMYLQEKDYETYLSRLSKTIIYFKNHSDYINGKVGKEYCLDKDHAFVIPEDDKMFCELLRAELATSSIAERYNKIQVSESELIKAKNILADYYLTNKDLERAEKYLVSQLTILEKCDYPNKKDDQLILFKKISNLCEKQGKPEIAKMLVDEDKDFSNKRYYQIQQQYLNRGIGRRRVIPIPQSPTNPQ